MGGKESGREGRREGGWEGERERDECTEKNRRGKMK